MIINIIPLIQLSLLVLLYFSALNECSLNLYCYIYILHKHRYVSVHTNMHILKINKSLIFTHTLHFLWFSVCVCVCMCVFLLQT